MKLLRGRVGAGKWLKPRYLTSTVSELTGVVGADALSSAFGIVGGVAVEELAPGDSKTVDILKVPTPI
jgi:hypothetical protein